VDGGGWMTAEFRVATRLIHSRNGGHEIRRNTVGGVSDHIDIHHRNRRVDASTSQFEVLSDGVHRERVHSGGA
jgi:hypothetical protein